MIYCFNIRVKQKNNWQIIFDLSKSVLITQFKNVQYNKKKKWISVDINQFNTIIKSFCNTVFFTIQNHFYPFPNKKKINFNPSPLLKIYSLFLLTPLSFSINFKMSHEYCSQQQPNPQLDHHLVNIKDYSQNDQSGVQEQDSPFDELENILEDDNRASRNEYRPTQRIQQLQTECRHLKEKCAKLGEKVNDLTSDLTGLEQCIKDDPESDPLSALDLMQKQMTEFKQSFEEYRNKQAKLAQQKDKEIFKLKQQLQKISAEKVQVQSQRNSLIQTNEELTQNNESLILQIQQLQMDLAQSRTEIQSSRSLRYNSIPNRRDHGFESQVQAQLQILIQKLMSELELQRGQKRRLNEQMKMMQKETMLLEREIAAKNSKIYQLEINYLKNGRNNTYNHSQRNNATTLATSHAIGHRETLNHRVRQPHPKAANQQRSYRQAKQARNQALSKSERTQSSPRSRTLMQVINNDDMQDRDRLILAVKLIDFFTKKITSGEYRCYELDSLLIGNFSKENVTPSLITVRKNTAASAPPPTDSTYDKMIFNLGEILDMLLGEYLSSAKTDDSDEEWALGLIGDIVTQKQGVNLNDVNVIKHLLEDCLMTMEQGRK